MIHKIKVLYGNNEEERGELAVRQLASAGINAYTCQQNGKIILENIREDNPDVVVMDIYLPTMDAIAVMDIVRSECNSVPKFVITLLHDSEFIKAELMGHGADYIMVMPYDYKMLAERIVSMMSLPFHRTVKHDIDATLEIEVTNIIQNLGILAKLRGYSYLREGILLVVKDPKMLDYITKSLYPEIARRFDTTPARVERAMRHAIDIAWEKSGSEIVDKYFGYKSLSLKRKPTNSEFIAVIADRLTLEIKHNII